MKLTPVVEVDPEKCVNCHMCISVCPVKYCIDGSGEHVDINHDLCIGCGSCIDACSHGARSLIDDSPRFFTDLERKVRMVAISAPAVAANFADSYLRLNGFLASLGVDAVFDVSFGAELTVHSYLAHIENKKPEMLIAQPCPAIVSYMEIYQPELLKYLAPAQSPMLHTIAMIREYYPEYKDHAVAVLSPCIAKKREFEETGLGDYNVTFTGIRAYLDRKKIDLSKYPELDFAGPLPERAVLFSSPGGLMRTVERERPGLVKRIRKIEGPETVYPYFKTLHHALKKGYNPLLVDCLNCSSGCNGGPGTPDRDKIVDEVEYSIQKRMEAARRKYKPTLLKGDKGITRKIRKVVKTYWKSGLYDRGYRDLSSNMQLRYPDAEQLQKIYADMKKTTDKDVLNCAACGYNSCEMMATAILNGLNKAENCHHYQTRMIVESQENTAGISTRLHEEILHSRELINSIEGLMENVRRKFESQHSFILQSSAVIEQMISSIRNTTRKSQEKQNAIVNLVDLARSGRKDMTDTVESIERVVDSIEDIDNLIAVLNDAADNTNILSINAAIEAAHAGAAGRGFAIVASEVRRLSVTSHRNSTTISGTLKDIISEIRNTSSVSQKTGESINEMIHHIQGVADSISEVIMAMDEMSVGGTQVTDSLSELKDMAADMHASQASMDEMLGNMRSVINSINDISERNIDSLRGEGQFRASPRWS